MWWQACLSNIPASCIWDSFIQWIKLANIYGHFCCVWHLPGAGSQSPGACVLCYRREEGPIYTEVNRTSTDYILGQQDLGCRELTLLSKFPLSTASNSICRGKMSAQLKRNGPENCQAFRMHPSWLPVGFQKGLCWSNKQWVTDVKCSELSHWPFSKQLDRKRKILKYTSFPPIVTKLLSLLNYEMTSMVVMFHS